LSDEEITIVRRCRLAKALACLVIALLIIAWAGLLNAMPPVQRSVRPNGLVLLTSEEHSLPFVTFSLLIHAGARRDPTGQEGLANLTARALLFGTAKLSMTTINEQLDFMGASLSSNAGMDYAVISLRVLKKDLKAGFKLFTEVLTEPAFPTAEVQKEVNRTLAAIKASEDDPGDVAEKAFMKTLYGTGPYAHPVIGTKESVERLKPQGLRDFYRSHYHPNNAIMVIVGDIGDEDLKKAILPQLEQWKAGDVRKSVAEASYETGKKTVMIDRPLTQAAADGGGQGQEGPCLLGV
jgi:zinc protease